MNVSSAITAQQTNINNMFNQLVSNVTGGIITDMGTAFTAIIFIVLILAGTAVLWDIFGSPWLAEKRMDRALNEAYFYGEEAGYSRDQVRAEVAKIKMRRSAKKAAGDF